MRSVETAHVMQGYRQRCEDRVAVFQAEGRAVVVVADGAGGTGSGDAAAQTVVREVEARYREIQSADGWSELLRSVDCQIGSGETTAVVVDIRPFGVAGSSVGDSQAWIIAGGEILDLTQGQFRKPLLGSGVATPISFVRPPMHGVLLVATDGLFDYANRSDIVQVVSQSEFYAIPRICVDLVQLPSGELWDDIGIVAARVQPPARSRKRYEI